MSRDPIKISADDLVSENVEGRLREQATVRSTKEHYERANVVAPEIVAVAGWRAWLLKSFVYLACFGFIGGAAGAAIGDNLVTRPDRNEEATLLMEDLRKIDRAEQVGRVDAEQAAQTRERIRNIGKRNAIFVAADSAEFKRAAVAADPRELAAGAAEDARVAARAMLLAFSIAGLLIGAALAAADRVIERDVRGCIIDGVLAGVGGSAVGAAIALLSPTIESTLLGRSAYGTTAARMLTHVATLALLGAGVGAMPGLVTRNGRRAGAGVVGGMIGGAIGGLLVEPVSKHLGGDPSAHAIAFALIGALIGATMGWFEEAGKQGWLRVASGLIAGKQFILYRNPTFVGSAPMSHIYLFRDKQVGRRHAAIFQVTGGYEIENLPLGGPTLVNGQPVSRTRLRRGDRIAIGRTTLVFDEKVGVMSATATTTSTATLLIDSGGDKIEPRAIGTDITIGRDRRCTVTIDHPTVSRTHARIYRDDKGWHFVDLGSQNGSKLGEERTTEPSRLRDGDELRLGRVRAWFFADSVPTGWSPPDAPRLAGKLIRCTCGHIGWAPIAAGDGQLRCTACGRDITRRDPNPPSRTISKPTATADCAACHTSIASGEAMHTCPDCAATMHAGCWEENRGCATYGCAQVGVLDAQTVDAEPEESTDEAPNATTASPRNTSMSDALKQSLMAVAAFAAAGVPLFGVPPIGYGAWLLVANDVHGEGKRRYLWAAISFAAGVLGFAFSARWWLGIRM